MCRLGSATPPADHTLLFKMIPPAQDTAKTVAIIGGGLSGWAAAYALASQSASPLRLYVVEAKPIHGGRTRSLSLVDIGGAWIWPSNPLSLKLVHDLKVPHLKDGMAGNGEIRLHDGMASLVQAMQDSVSKQPHVNLTTQLSCRVTGIRYDQRKVLLDIEGAESLQVDQAIVALPTRLAARTIGFTPPLDSTLHRAMLKQNIWMAAMAKVSLRFSAPWWTSGPYPINNLRAPSRSIVQLMDASTSTAGHAVVAFAVPPPDDLPTPEGSMSSSSNGNMSPRQAWLGEITDAIKTLAQRQFYVTEDTWRSTLEGVDFYSWRHDPLVFATDGVHEPGHGVYFQHPYDGGNQLREPIRFKDSLDVAVVMAGSETDDEYPGFIEGALRAGFRAAASILAN
ncbi:Aste57867_9577 [Aphanomyces stellatus]|uniref:monoamine oxidase n=1 Tax=Aphanomyces stellatus TaxID=120398 RepID=A0A485KNC2_9STRA|nr:hypothetical protein As57867_009539 [Aphanomyces stellatus]VFT86456.1 Aste57867_9577 [Aphanomyces stellatus]